MRWLGFALILLVLPFAGCTQNSGGSSLRPPCSETSPVGVDIATDKERYFPGEVMNVTLGLNNTGSTPATVQYRSWELTMRSFDGGLIRTWLHDETAGRGSATKRVNPGGFVVLQSRFQAFRVNGDLFDPLPRGTYYLCAVVTGSNGVALATGSHPFIAERANQIR